MKLAIDVDDHGGQECGATTPRKPKIGFQIADTALVLKLLEIPSPILRTYPGAQFGHRVASVFSRLRPLARRNSSLMSMSFPSLNLVRVTMSGTASNSCASSPRSGQAPFPIHEGFDQKGLGPIVILKRGKLNVKAPMAAATLMISNR